MNIKKPFFLPILLLCAYSCSPNQEAAEGGPVTLNNAIKAIDYLDTLKIDRGLFETSGLVANDQFLFSLDRESNPVVKVYDHRTGAYQGGFGTQGNGPGEFAFANTMTRRGNDVIISDLKYVRGYAVSAEADQLNTKMKFEVRIPGAYMPFNSSFIIDDNTIGGIVDFSTELFSIFNMSGDTSSFGSYPDLASHIPKTAYHHLYVGQSRIRQDGSKIATTFSNFPLLRILDTKSGVGQNVFVSPKNAQKKVVAAPHGRSIESFDLYKYFGAIQVNEEFILSTYSEYEMIRSESTNQWVESILTNPAILVFNWEGEPVIKLFVEEWMTRYTITPDNRIILFHPEEKDELYIIDLNRLLN